MNNIESKNIKEWYISNFKTFEEKLNGQSKSFLQTIRKEGLKQLSVLDFPTTRNEEWKYTDVSPVLKQFFVPAVNSPAAVFSKEEIKKHLFVDFDFHLLVFINGLFSKELSEIGDLPSGVVVGSLNKITIDNPELIKNYINKVSVIDNAFNALNTAYAFDGAVIIIPDGKIIEKPVQILYINTSNEDFILSSPRNLVVAGKNSQVSIVANYTGSGSKAYFSNIITEVYADEYSLVDYYKIENEINEAFHIEKFQVKQKNNSIVNHYNITFGGALIRNDINSLLDGQHTETHYYGIYLANGSQQMDNHTFIDHAKPNCMSNELYKGILDGNSRGVFNGKIIVRKDAQKTNAYQQNKTILLSKSAKIDTKPQLEIFADDVKCSHGATVGQLDDVSEFYIRSRGVPQELAKSMLIRAFANDVIEKIKIEQLRLQINRMIFQHLSGIEIEEK
jgi:Fe-S cluster assembly protein SufD